MVDSRHRGRSGGKKGAVCAEERMREREEAGRRKSAADTAGNRHGRVKAAQTDTAVKIRRAKTAVLRALLCTAAVLTILPLGAVVFLSFEGGAGAYADFFVWEPEYLYALMNSLAAACAAAGGAILAAVPAAYVFAKVKFRGKGVIFYWYVIVMIMPFQVTMLPQYLASRRLGIYDTPFALILPGIFAPFAVFLLTQIMKSVPNEAIEAARLETSSTALILLKILVPMAKPGVLCAGVIAFTEQWNAVSEPITLLENTERFPLAVILNRLSENGTVVFAAAAVFSSVPLLLFLLFEEEVMEGLGGYKLR